MPTHRISLQFLTDDELDQIEETAYRLLEDVGISLQHPGAVERLSGLGCKIGPERVQIPRDVIRRALEHIVRYDTLYSADASRSLVVGDGQIHFHSTGGLPFLYDLETDERRLATLQDVADAARLMDALPNVDVVIPTCGAQDVPAEMMTIASADAMLRNTSKPMGVAAAEKPADVRYLVAMAAACCGGEEAFRHRPTTGIMVSPVSPLTFTEQVTATIMAVAESGAAFQSLPAPSLGATGPITMAGVLAQQHAELLASYVIVAATRPGTPVMYCSRVNGIDLRSAVSVWGSPEVGMTAAVAGQLAHRLGLTCDAYGLACTSARLDPQLAYERFTNAFMPALVGVDLMSGVGVMENNLAASFQVAVIDDEIIGLIRRVVRGCDVDEDTLAFDVMRDVIPRDGIFMGETHTVRHMRQGAVWNSKLTRRGAGADLAGIARAQAREILRTHVVEPLPPATLGCLDDIVAEAWRELAPSAKGDV